MNENPRKGGKENEKNDSIYLTTNVKIAKK
jgi:hypothetical protein